ncbi:unnamed protein product [Closterium sp. NIES-65]|nr:unnamed protein product [Closterium sp. NIES-65]
MDFFGQGKSWPAKDPAPFPAAASARLGASASAAAEEEEALLRGAEEGRGGQRESTESSKSTTAAVADWGFGPRPEPWARDLVYGSDMWCEQVAAFISQVIQEPVFIAGNSLGGYIGAYLAASHPHLCRGLILLNATPFWAFSPNPHAPARSLLARLYPFSWRGTLPVPTLPRLVARRWWDSLRHPTTLRSLLTLVYTDAARLTPALIDCIAQPTQHPASAAAFASILFAPKARLSFDENLTTITSRALPVCIIHGRDDPWVGPMWAARAARALPHAAFFELSPAGHCPHHERPQVVNYLISSWVSHVHSNFSNPLPLSPVPHFTHSLSDSPSPPSLASSSSSPPSQPSADRPWSFPSLLGEGEWEEGVWIDGVGLRTSSAEKQGNVTVKSAGGPCAGRSTAHRSARRFETMARNSLATVFVGNLDQQVEDRILYDLMQQAGPLVDLHVPRDKASGQHRGYGFAEYETEESAQYAVKLFSGLVRLFNRQLRFQISNSGAKPAAATEDPAATGNGTSRYITMLGEILTVQPLELKFTFELKKQVSTSLRLVNVTSEYVAFKVKTTSPKKYCVRPNTGLIPPQSSAEVVVTMQAQKEMPADMQCKDKFLVQSVLVPGGAPKEASADFFNKENGREVHEVKLRVLYVAPPQPPSPVAETAEEGGTPSSFPPTAKAVAPTDPGSKDVTELKAKLTEAKAALTKMTDDRNAAVRELQRLKEQASKAGSKAPVQRPKGWSFTALLLAALIFFIVGFLGGKGYLTSSPAAASSTEL